MIVDVTSRHDWASQDSRYPFVPDPPRSPTMRPRRQTVASAGGSLSGYARQPLTRTSLLTLIDAPFSPWLPP